MDNLNTKGQGLAKNLLLLKKHQAKQETAYNKREKVNVVGAGGIVTAAYEQLRNAAENSEEHLLLQNAIKRFFKRSFLLRDITLIYQSGNELAIELTLAGYVQNNSLTERQVSTISTIAVEYYQAYERIMQDRSISADRANKWVIDTLAVEASSILKDNAEDKLFVDFAHTELSEIIDEKALFGHKAEDFGASLFVAIHRSLLKSDLAVVRYALIERYQVKVHDLERYIEFNRSIDGLMASETTNKLMHAVDRQGAPLRILRQMMRENSELAEILPKREVFLDNFEKQVQREYERVGQKLNRAIVRSVIFLIITKVLIGVAIEVPYDYLAHGRIVWLPLIINLLFPPLYMLALRATHSLPGKANTDALIDRIDTMLYGNRLVLEKSTVADKRHGAIFSFVYIVSSLVIFGAVTYGLLLLQFSLVHILIFFMFLSAASFLGFRLSRLIRELEIVRSAQNGVTFIRDLLYLPFAVVGRWMSEKYSQVNIVAIMLDMLIELPLKTVLRFVRQWGAFIDDRKDRL